MSLGHRLSRLEVLVSARAGVDTEQEALRAAHFERWSAWANRILLTMKPARVHWVYQEMLGQPRESWGSVARRVDHLAAMGADGHYDSAGWPHWSERAIALPEAVCAVLEQYPDAGFTFDYSCEDCGLETPHLPRVVGVGWAALFTVCPLCAGEVKHCGYTDRRLRQASERAKA
jgi:hypothetical protein